MNKEPLPVNYLKRPLFNERLQKILVSVPFVFFIIYILLYLISLLSIYQVIATNDMYALQDIKNDKLHKVISINNEDVIALGKTLFVNEVEADDSVYECILTGNEDVPFMYRCGSFSFKVENDFYVHAISNNNGVSTLANDLLSKTFKVEEGHIIYFVSINKDNNVVVNFTDESVVDKNNKANLDIDKTDSKYKVKVHECIKDKIDTSDKILCTRLPDGVYYSESGYALLQNLDSNYIFTFFRSTNAIVVVMCATVFLLFLAYMNGNREEYVVFSNKYILRFAVILYLNLIFLLFFLTRYLFAIIPTEII